MADPSPRLVVLARPGAAGGFRLAGVAVVEAAEGAEPAALREAVVAAAGGVVAVDEEVLALVPADARPRAAVPVLLPFALPRRWTEEGRGRAWVAALVRRAVGYHVKLGEERR